MNTKRKNIGLLLALQKKSLIVTNDDVKQEPEIVLQILFDPNVFDLFPKVETLFMKRLGEYAFNAYGVHKYGEDFKNLDESKIKEEYSYFMQNYDILVSHTPILFDYVLDDLTTQEEIQAYIRIPEHSLQ